MGVIVLSLVVEGGQAHLEADLRAQTNVVQLFLFLESCYYGAHCGVVSVEVVLS